MRVVAGTVGGRRLRAPKGRDVRPTTDRVKEAVFSMLASRGGLEGARILDLFAGTGNLGIEALSRGAAAAVFVEPHRSASAALRANLGLTGFAGDVIATPAARAIATLVAAGQRFTGVFLDPPYDRGWVEPTLVLLDEARIVGPGGWIIVEHGRREEPPIRVGRFVHRVGRRYGDSGIVLYEVDRGQSRVRRG